MDINDKIAARRRELEAEARRKTAEELEIHRQADEAKKRQDAAEKAALDKAVDQRLSEQGIKVTPPSEEKISAEIEARLQKEAAERMTTGEKNKLGVIVLLGVVSIFISFWLVPVFVVIYFGYNQAKIEKYKKQILEEAAAAKVPRRLG